MAKSRSWLLYWSSVTSRSRFLFAANAAMINESYFLVGSDGEDLGLMLSVYTCVR